MYVAFVASLILNTHPVDNTNISVIIRAKVVLSLPIPVGHKRHVFSQYMCLLVILNLITMSAESYSFFANIDNKNTKVSIPNQKPLQRATKTSYEI